MKTGMIISEYLFTVGSLFHVTGPRYLIH